MAQEGVRHGPGGHASEDALSPYVDGGYDHAVWGADVTLSSLNLCRETLDGVRTTRVVGTVDLRDLPQFNQATPIPTDDFLALEEMPITIWIDEEGHVLSMELEGPITADESPDVVRRLDITAINEPVDITEPVSA